MPFHEPLELNPLGSSFIMQKYSIQSDLRLEEEYNGDIVSTDDNTYGDSTSGSVVRWVRGGLLNLPKPSATS